MPSKQRLTHKKRKTKSDKQRRLGGAVRIDEGPFDDFNHILKKI